MTNVMNNTDPTLNKDLILREYLAIERTKMANHRTLLSFLRTGLYFLVAGSTLGQLIDTYFWKYMGLPFTISGIIIAALGLINYLRSRRKITDSRLQIGKITDDFLSSVNR
jgi:putative membrane protein